MLIFFQFFQVYSIIMQNFPCPTKNYSHTLLTRLINARLNTTHPANAAPFPSFPPSLPSYLLLVWERAHMEWRRGVWDGTRRKAAAAAQAPMEADGVGEEGGGRDAGGGEAGEALDGGVVEGEDDSVRLYSWKGREKGEEVDKGEEVAKHE